MHYLFFVQTKKQSRSIAGSSSLCHSLVRHTFIHQASPSFSLSEKRRSGTFNISKHFIYHIIIRPSVNNNLHCLIIPLVFLQLNLQINLPINLRSHSPSPPTGGRLGGAWAPTPNTQTHYLRSSILYN